MEAESRRTEACMERLGRFLGAFFGAFLCVVLLMGIYSMAEDITLTTYYPAPYGAYEELSTTGNTYLATDSGKNVGMGLATTETIKNKLDVKGSVAIGADYSGVSTAPTNGMIVQGQVGIGTISPTAGTALDVSGTINATAYSAGGTAGAEDKTFTVLGGDGITIYTIVVKKGIITSITP